MSAYIVDRNTIRYLISAVQSVLSSGGYSSVGGLRPVQRMSLDKLGQLLWTENYNSVCHRYPQHDNVRPIYDNHTPWRGPLDWAQVIQTANCLAYQSCEHPGWEQSYASQVLEALKTDALAQITKDCAWGAPQEPA